MSLVDKIRKARERRVEAGGFTFVIRRPTDIDMFELRGNVSAKRLFPFIIGWDGVKELDIIPGGDPHPLPFDADVCAEWLSDRADLLGPVVDAIIGSYQLYAKQMDDAKKK